MRFEKKNSLGFRQIYPVRSVLLQRLRTSVGKLLLQFESQITKLNRPLERRGEERDKLASIAVGTDKDSVWTALIKF